MRKLQRFLALLCIGMMMFLNSSEVKAQKGANDLRSFAVRANAGSEIRFVFSATDNKGKEIYNETGKVTILGDKYRMEVPGDLLVVNNGNTRWIYKPQEEEIVIAPNNPGEDDILENPFALLSATNKGTIKNYSVLVVERKGSVPKELLGVPEKIVLIATGGAKYTILITGFKPSNGLLNTMFELDPQKYPGAITTDLR